MLAANQRSQFRGQTNNFWIDQALTDQDRIIVDKANHAKPRIGPAQCLARDLDGERPRADDQNALADFGMAQNPMNTQAPTNHQQESERQGYQRNAASNHHLRHQIED